MAFSQIKKPDISRRCGHVGVFDVNVDTFMHLDKSVWIGIMAQITATQCKAFDLVFTRERCSKKAIDIREKR